MFLKEKTRACEIFLRHSDIQREYSKPAILRYQGLIYFLYNIAVPQKKSTSACLYLNSTNNLRFQIEMTLRHRKITEMHVFIYYSFNNAQKVVFFSILYRKVTFHYVNVFILLAVLCETAGTIFSLFLAGKLKMQSLQN